MRLPVLTSPSSPTKPARLALRALLIVALLALVACDDDTRPIGSRADAGQDASDTSGDASSDPSSDTQTEDVPPTSITCDNAGPRVEGGACPRDGLQCDYVCGGPCSECSGYECSGGVWYVYRDYPAPDCNNPQPPVTDDCTPLGGGSGCADGEGCYWDEGEARFVCLPPGELEEEDVCDAPNACQPGLICVTRQFPGAPRTACYVACDPATEDGICGGPCDPMSLHGYDGREDVGFCYFLGG